MSAAPIACVTGCGRKARQRGLCAQHYAQARRRVSRGEVTWAELEKAGQAAAPRRSPWYNSTRWFRAP
jgi:hypothetical protein